MEPPLASRWTDDSILIAGLVLGGIYALVAAGLVVTYTSSGILNFAFGSMAYFIAKLYFFLHTQHAWSTAVAVFFCLVVVAPLLGAMLEAVLFRSLQDSTTLVKIVRDNRPLRCNPGSSRHRVRE